MTKKEENLEPNSLESLIEEYYSKNKNLNEDKIKRVPGKFEEKRKDELIKIIRKNDFDLEKTKKMLVFVGQLTGLNTHQEQLCNFISDVVMKHDVMADQEKIDWFSDKQISKIQFTKLFGLKEISKEKLLLDEEKIIDGQKKNTLQKAQTKLETDIKKARLNALNISLLWRYRTKIVSFKKFLEELQLNTYVAHITVRESKIALDLSRAQAEKKEAQIIIDKKTEILKNLKDDLKIKEEEEEINTKTTDKKTFKDITEKIKKIKATEKIDKETRKKAEETLEIARNKIKAIENRSKNNHIFNQELNEKIIPFILSSKQDDINNISNLMNFYDEKNQDDKKLLTDQYSINLKLESAIEKLNEKISEHQSNEENFKVDLNIHIETIEELKLELARNEQSKIDSRISTRDKENSMKGDLNNLINNEIPKIEDALKAIEMGHNPVVKQYLVRLLDKFKSKLNDSLGEN